MAPHRSKSQAPPVLIAWAAFIILWPLSDVLRKWGGLNQPLYIFQLLTPFLIAFYLLLNNALTFTPGIVLPCAVLVCITGVMALFHAFSGYGIAYIGVWFLSLSALIGPALLLCADRPGFSPDASWIKRQFPALIVLLSLLLLVNNLLMVAQSLLPASHILSSGVGGVLEAQSSTNTQIQIRAPGLFAFNVSAGLFNLNVTIFLLATLRRASLSLPFRVVRLLALLSLPLALVRSISRQFLFGFLVVFLPLLPQIGRPRFLLRILLALMVASLATFLLPDLQALIVDGYINFRRRFLDAGGFEQGIIFRFYQTLFSDYVGSDQSLLASFMDWFDSDPLVSFFGNGLGFSSPLFRFVQGSADLAYGFVSIKGKEFLVGETAIPSLFADIGLIGVGVYLWLFVNVILVFVRRFSPGLLRIKNAIYASSMMLILVPFHQVYFRPFTILPLTSAFLLPFALHSLFPVTRLVTNFGTSESLSSQQLREHRP